MFDTARRECLYYSSSIFLLNVFFLVTYICDCGPCLQPFDLVSIITAVMAAMEAARCCANSRATVPVTVPAIAAAALLSFALLNL